MDERFEIRRADGRSHQEVLINHVAQSEPGTIFRYESLLEVMNDGVDPDHPLDRFRLCAIVRLANLQLLKSYQRELRNIRRTGFRMASASEQLVLAEHRRGKAKRQMSRGLLDVENIRFDELTASEQLLHARQIVGFKIVYHMIRGLHARQDRQEEVIEKLLKRQDEYAAQLDELKKKKSTFPAGPGPA